MFLNFTFAIHSKISEPSCPGNGPWSAQDKFVGLGLAKGSEKTPVSCDDFLEPLPGPAGRQQRHLVGPAEDLDQQPVDKVSIVVRI